MKTQMVWSHLAFLWYGNDSSARHRRKDQKKRQVEEKLWRQRQGLSRPILVLQDRKGQLRQSTAEIHDPKVISGAPSIDQVTSE